VTGVARSYLVEVYTPRDNREALAATVSRARAAALALRHEGVPVRYLRPIYVPEDETCFHVFEAPSAQAVGEASRRAGLNHDRIVEAVR
jgi:hypothetical protein